MSNKFNANTLTVQFSVSITLPCFDKATWTFTQSYMEFLVCLLKSLATEDIII